MLGGGRASVRWVLCGRATCAVVALWVLGCGCRVYDGTLLALGPNDAPAPLDAGRKDAATGTVDARVPTDPGTGGAAPNTGMDATAPGQPDAGGVDEDAGDQPSDAGSDAGGDAGDAGAVACTAASVGNYCDHIPVMSTAPTIDGELDCELALLPMAPVAWNGTAPMPSDHSTRIASAWRANGLYLYIEVKDPSLAPHPSGSAIYCGDAVEIYVDADGVGDGNYSDPGTMQFIIAAPVAASPGTIETKRYVGGNERSWTSAMLKTKVRADGYAVETFLTAADLNLAAWSLTTRVGLDIALGVSGSNMPDCGSKIGQYFMRVDPSAGTAREGEPWGNTDAFCTPALDPAP